VNPQLAAYASPAQYRAVNSQGMAPHPQQMRPYRQQQQQQDHEKRDEDGRRICRHWEKGNCSLGDICGFAHPQWAFKTRAGYVPKAGEEENEVEQVRLIA
jgi:hypothetical protein